MKAGRLVRGYQQALLRFQSAAMDKDPEPAFFALFEALNWATAIDDVIAETWRPAGDREGFNWRGRVEGAAVLDGVRYVRNRVHHQWADALRIEEGARFPLRLPFTFFSWVGEAWTICLLLTRKDQMSVGERRTSSIWPTSGPPTASPICRPSSGASSRC